MPDLETSLYSVSLLNDEQTPMEFVVHVLEAFFDMDRDTATQKMLLIHHQGTAECGHYPYELAKKKAADVVAFARQHKHPLQNAPSKKLFGYPRRSSILTNVRFGSKADICGATSHVRFALESV